LLQREGSKDFFWKARMVDLDRDECDIDIRHIFPRAWCEAQKIEPRVFNAIVNKTPISYKANRMIGGKAPSGYLEQIRNHRQAQMSEAEQDVILRTHLIDPVCLRGDYFFGFYAARKEALLKIIDVTMDKRILPIAMNAEIASDSKASPTTTRRPTQTGQGQSRYFLASGRVAGRQRESSRS
jgi:hypothetical protein